MGAAGVTRKVNSYPKLFAKPWLLSLSPFLELSLFDSTQIWTS